MLSPEPQKAKRKVALRQSKSAEAPLVNVPALASTTRGTIALAS